MRRAERTLAALGSETGLGQAARARSVQSAVDERLDDCRRHIVVAPDLEASGSSRALLRPGLCYRGEFALYVVYQFAVEHEVPA